MYVPAQSSTSKPVLCSDPLCDKATTCAAVSDQCPYEINYVSANTSTSGTLYEDYMYFKREAGGSAVKLPVYLGYVGSPTNKISSARILIAHNGVPCHPSRITF